MPKKFHYIYKITVVGSDCFYIGMHSTDNLDDGYLGSGKIIAASIKKHGKEKHIKQILESHPTREALRLRERELVNEELLRDENCLNLVRGGDGGFEPGGTIARYVSGHARLRWARDKDKLKASMKKAADNPETRARLSRGTLKQWEDPAFRQLVSDVARSRTGEKHSQFGSCWMNKDGANKLVKPEDVQAFVENGYTKGRLMNTGFLNKGSFWMNNGQVEVKAREDQVNDLLSKGYQMGRLQKKVLTTEATPHIGGTQLLQEGKTL